VNFPDWREWLYSAKAFIAAMLALYIALELALPNPYWAVASVYVVSHPLSGATRSKGMYRACGTVLGAIASVLIVPACVDAPVLLTLVMTAWTGAMLYLALLDRTPRSYVFMLAAYTTPLIVLPTLMAPQTIFDVALARTEEIVLGISCASLINTVFFPSRIAPVLNAQMASLLRDAAGWASGLLAVDAPLAADHTQRNRLLMDVVAMDTLIRQLSYDSASSRQAGHAQQMRRRMTLLIPQVSALFDPLYALSRHVDGIPPGLTALVEKTTAWMRQGTQAAPETADGLRRELSMLEAALPADRRFDDALIANAFLRLGELIDLWRDCVNLQHAYAPGASGRVPDLVYRVARTIGTTRYYDHALLSFSVGSAMLAMAVAIALWVLVGWEYGASGAVLAIVACCFFAASDNPAPQVARFLYWVVVAVVFAGVYLFGILPAIHTFAGLAGVLAIPLLFAGAFTGRPQFNMSVLLFTAQVISDLGLGSAYAVEPQTFFNTSVSSVVGMVFALVWTLVAKPFGAEVAASRLARAAWRDLAALAMARKLRDNADRAARMTDRICQLLPRLGLLEDQALARMDSVRDLRVGYRLLDLQKQMRRLNKENAGPVAAVLRLVAAHYRQCGQEGRPLDPPPALRTSLDGAIRALLPLPEDASHAAVLALVGLRLAMFPELAEQDPEPVALPLWPQPA
jgi:uncharacterized membrane protein YccC